LAGIIDHDTIGSQSSVKEIVEDIFVIDWLCYGEKPRRIHAPPYREDSFQTGEFLASRILACLVFKFPQTFSGSTAAHL